MNKAAHDHRPLFDPWLAWEQLPDPVREQALDVLTALYLEATELPDANEQITATAPIVDSDRSRLHGSSQHGVAVR